MSSSSGTVAATRRITREHPRADRALLELPFVNVPEDAGVGRVPGETLQRGWYRVELGDRGERQLGQQLGAPPLRVDQQALAFRLVYGAIGGIRELGDALILEIVDVAAARRHAVGGEEQRQL